jgi:hypothetical protein
LIESANDSQKYKSGEKEKKNTADLNQTVRQQIQSPKRNSHALSGWDGFSLTTLDIGKPSPAPCWKAPSIRTIRYFGDSIDRLRAPYGLWSAVEHEGT